MFCIKCGNEAKSGQGFCVKCGNRLDVEDPVPAAIDNPAQSQYPANQQPAPQPYNRPPQTAGVQTKNKKKRNLAIAVAASAVIVVAVALFFGFRLWDRGSDDYEDSQSNTSHTEGEASSTTPQSETAATPSPGSSATSTESAPPLTQPSPPPSPPKPTPSPKPPSPSPPRPPVEPPAAGTFADYISIIVDSQIAALNPMSQSGGTMAANWVYTMIYDRLLYYNVNDASFEPMLATSWHTSDCKVFRFTLRDNVYFHNGNHFTAHDVAYTAQLGKSSGGSPGFMLWNPVEAVNIINDYEIEIVLSSANADFYYDMAMPAAGILNERAVSADPEFGASVGTGAFIVDWFSVYDRVNLLRNENYWGAIAPTREISLFFVAEPSARTIMMEVGEADVCFGISSDDIDYIIRGNTDAYSIFPVTMLNPQGLSFNLSDPIMLDYNFRLAICHALDLEEIAILAAGNGAVAAYDSGLWGLDTPFRNNSLPAFSYDPDLAKAYLDVSAYKGETLEISVASPINVRAAEVIQYQLNAIGVRANINMYDYPSFMALLAEPARTQLVLHGFAFTVNPASARQHFVPGGAQNRAMYNDPEVTRLFDEAAAEPNEDRRRELYQRAQEIIASERPYLNIMWLVREIVSVSGIGGLRVPSDMQLTDLRYVYLLE